MAEKLAVEQALGKRRAVHLDEGPGPAWREVVKAGGDELFAGAALADDQHRAIERRHARDMGEHVAKGGRFAEEGREIRGGGSYI